MGIYSGSDNPVKAIFDLQNMGLFGESHVGSDESLVHVTKSHYPINFGIAQPLFNANK